jgi:hypothetical protein
MKLMKLRIAFLFWISALFVYGQAALASGNRAGDEQAIRRVNEEALEPTTWETSTRSTGLKTPTSP